MGLEVTDKELLAKIMSFPAFKRSDGSFVGEDLYGRILRANQTTPEEFEEGLRQELMLKKLQQTLAAGIVIPDSEVEQEYRRRNETASFEVLFVPVDAGACRSDRDRRRRQGVLRRHTRRASRTRSSGSSATCWSTTPSCAAP